MRLAEDNSAIYGGFAYLEGPGTRLWIRPSENEEKPLIMRRQNGYFGGAIYMHDHA